MYMLRYLCTWLSILFFISYNNSCFAQEGGYVNKFTTGKGDTVRFYISTSKDTFTLSIYRIEEEDKLFTSFDGIKGGIQTVRDSSYWYGCRWNESFLLKIPESWEPGAYRAVFPTTDSTAGIIFFVSAKQPGTFSKILFVASTNTWNAYNFFGGKSIYDFNSTDSEPSTKVSFLRPNWYPYGGLDFYSFEREAIQWLARNNVYPEFISDTELHTQQYILQNYNIIFIVGHSEYWTNEQRWQFQKYLNNGGKIIILAGASCWSQVRIEEDKMVKYRPTESDPLFGVVDSLVTTIFNFPPLNWPENELTGVSGWFGGYINHNGTYDDSEGYSDYAAYNTHHWIFDGTFLREGEEYGFDDHIVGNENDGAAFEWKNGIPVVTGENNTPLNFRILSMSPASGLRANQGIQGWATMGMFYHPGGGAVFNTSTIRWAWGLESNYVVQRITKNVLHKFINNEFPPDIISWSPAIVDSLLINKAMHKVNRRDYFLNNNSLNQTFSVEAEDPFGGSLRYFWTENGVITGNYATHSINKSNLFGNSKKYTVTAYVYNNKDTSSITWNYFNSELSFSSDPETLIKAGDDFYYAPIVFNYYNDDLDFELIDSPSWVMLDSNNRLSGKVPADPDTYQVSIRVTNEHNQSDTQTFTLISSESVSDVPEFPKPGNYSLSQNFPNPFNPVTAISYRIMESGNVVIEIFDILGNKIETLVNEVQAAGEYEVKFDASNLTSGVYFYTIKSGNFFDTKKMILLR